jgi:alpha-ribazole phosphatase
VNLWLARHAATVAAAGLCYGRSDVPADAMATQVAARRLADVLPAGLQVASSPLARCTGLASALQALRPELTIRIDARLAEMDFGTWEGQAWDTLGAAAMQAWMDDFEHHAPGGGESVARFMARVASVFDEAVATRRDTLWITHAGVIRAAALLSRGVRRVTHARDWPREGLAFGAWQVLEL